MKIAGEVIEKEIIQRVNDLLGRLGKCLQCLTPREPTNHHRGSSLISKNTASLESLLSGKDSSLQRMINDWKNLSESIWIPHNRRNVLAAAGQGLATLSARKTTRVHESNTTHLSYVFIAHFSSLVISNHLGLVEIHVYPRIPEPEDNVVQSHEESSKQEEAIRHNTYFARQHRNTIISQLILVEHHIIEE